MNDHLPPNLQDADEVIEAEEIDRAVDWYREKYGEEPKTPMAAFDMYCDWCETAGEDD